MSAAEETEPVEAWVPRQPPLGELTYQEFLDWCDEDTWAEWVDGRVVMVSPANLRHQEVSGFLFRLVSHWVEAYDLGVVLQPPFQMRLPEPLRSGREPDLIFIAAEHRERLRSTYLDGPADLVLEVISPESLGRDRGEKFAEYERAGISEYWLVDPDRQQAEFYQLGDSGRYRMALAGSTGRYRSPTLAGLALEIDWLWREPPPKLTQVLAELGVR